MYEHMYINNICNTYIDKTNTTNNINDIYINNIKSECNNFNINIKNEYPFIFYRDATEIKYKIKYIFNNYDNILSKLNKYKE